MCRKANLHDVIEIESDFLGACALVSKNTNPQNIKIKIT